MRVRIVDLIFDGIELAVAAYDWVRKVRKRKRPEPGSMPLTFKEVAHNQAQIKAATERKVPR